MFLDSPPIRTDIEPSLHPDVLGREAKALDVENTIGRHALTDARAAMTVAYTSIGDLNDAVNAVRNATASGGVRMVKGTPTRHFPPSEELLSAADRAYNRAARQIDASVASLNNHIRALQHRVDAAVDDTTARTPLAAEVRHHVKTLKGERMGFVMKLIDTGDKGSVASILGAPSYLSGLTDKDIGPLREYAARKWAPIDTEQLAATKLVLERVQVSGGRLLERFMAVLNSRDAPTVKAGDSIKRLAG